MQMRKMWTGIVAAAVLLGAGCGGDRSTFYDADGNRVGSSGHGKWIYESDAGRKMVAANFVYIPGGFDVDGDGQNESGFWLAKYEARETNETVSGTESTAVSDLIRSHFLLYDAKSRRFDAQIPADSSVDRNTPASQILGFHANRVIFSPEGNATGSYSAVEAIVALEHSQVAGVQKWHVSLPTEKQWMQVVKLAINNKENWTGGKVGEGRLYRGKRYNGSDRNYLVIGNGVLGKDPHVSADYSVHVYDFSGNLAEWTRGLIAVDDRFLGGNSGETEFTKLGADTPRWWLPILEGESFPLSSIEGVGKYFDGSTLSGASDTLNITGSTGFVDPYAVDVRGGSSSRGDQSLTGLSAAKFEYGPGFKDPAIGFRGASDYIE